MACFGLFRLASAVTPHMIERGGGTIIVTSATIDPDRFSRHFGNAPIIEVSGRVVSTDGPAVTTIDATGQACTRSDCLPSTTNLTCQLLTVGVSYLCP